MAGKSVTFSADLQYFDKNMMHKIHEMNLFCTPMATSGGGGGVTVALGSNEEEAFEMTQINDFTIEEIKSEMHVYEECGELPTQRVCPAYHGGPLDYPKVATAAAAHVAEKWDYCYDLLEDVIEKRMQESEQARKRCVRSSSDDEVYERLTGAPVPVPAPSPAPAVKHHKSSAGAVSDTKQADNPQVNEDEFFSAVSESTSKLCIHYANVCRQLLCKGDVNSILRVIGGLCLIRNKLWVYNASLVVGGHPRPFRDQYTEVCQMVEALAEQVLEYNCALAATDVLHDAEGQDWANPKPFFEGEKISHCVQMWWFFMQGLRADLWDSVPPKMASQIMAGVFCESLSILTHRYTNLSPSSGRLAQFRGDVSALLLACAELLPALCPSVDRLFCPDALPSAAVGAAAASAPQSAATLLQLHAQCGHLMAALAVVGAPAAAVRAALTEAKAKAPAKTKTKGSKSKNVQQATSRAENENRLTWLTLLRGDSFCVRASDLSPASHIGLIAKLAAAHPEPNWPMLVQLLLCRDQTVSKLIMVHFGAFVPQPSSSSVNPEEAGHVCGGFSCRGECVLAADSMWPVDVAQAVLTVCINGLRSPDSLWTALTPLLDQLAKSSWSSLSWPPTSARPVWLAAVAGLLDGHVMPVVHELLERVDGLKMWAASHIPGALRDALTGLAEVAVAVPRQILVLAANIEAKMPKEAKPMCGSVATHCLLASLHSCLTRALVVLRTRNVHNDKTDIIATFVNALQNADERTYPELRQICDASRQALSSWSELDAEVGVAKGVSERCFDVSEHDFSLSAAEAASNAMLADGEGRAALKVVHRFVAFNAEWIAQQAAKQSSTSSSSSVIPVLIRPWTSSMSPASNPYEMMNRIGAFRCDDGRAGVGPVVDGDRVVLSADGHGTAVFGGKENNASRNYGFERVMALDHRWDAYLRHAVATSSPIVVAKMLRQRPEASIDNEDDGCSAADRADVAEAIRVATEELA